MALLVLKNFNVRSYLIVNAAESLSKESGPGFIKPFVGSTVRVAVFAGFHLVLSKEAFLSQ